tara:strand:+ start:2543 stop:3559 length:1017 start_codon:yes stop_codon:yes gene_type:complete
VRVREDYRTLGGREKAAIFLLSIGEDSAAMLFEHMDTDEILELSQTMSNLGVVNAAVIEKLFIDFADQMSSTSSLVGSFDTTERLLSKVLGKDNVNNIMEEIRGPAGRTMWEKLTNVNEEVLANFLKKEYPQTVAVVLSKIGTEHAAAVLSLLPESFSMEVITRMLRMEVVQKEVLEDVEKTLRTEFMSNLARTSKQDPHEMMAEIFNNFDRTVESNLMTALEERSKDSAERIRELMFTFEDLMVLDSQGAQAVIRAVDRDKLSLALKGASDGLKDLFFNNMSERAAKIMREDMTAMGPVRLKDVEDAQMVMVNAAKDLASKGEIILTSGSDDEEMIY